MKRVLVFVLVSASMAGTAAAATTAEPASTTALRRTRLLDFVCHRALRPSQRWVAVTAVMRPVSGTGKLQLRVQLLAKSRGGQSFTEITGGDLGKWKSPSNPTLGTIPGDVWVLKKKVVDLRAPAQYRFQVAFRWIGAQHRVIATAMRASATCSEPELRPDLQVGPVAVQPAAGQSQKDVYVTTITNAGATAAGPFNVRFTPGGGAPSQTLSLPGLGAGQSLTVRFTGPVCAADTAPTIVADPNDQVDDFDRANNSVTVTCPS